MEKVLGFLTPIILYFILFVFNAVLPGRWVIGYATKAGTDEKLRYRLNGLLVLIVSVLIWIGVCYFGLLSWTWLNDVRWYSLAGAITFGLIFSFALVIGAPAVKSSFWVDFFLGRVENPQLWGGRIDAKMWLYLIGAVLLQLNLLSFGAHHYLVYGQNAAIGIFISIGLFTYFLVDYMTFEEVHLYTYDLFAERVGFKLGWGCIAFYPFFYTIPLWSTVDLPNPNSPTILWVAAILVFFTGWGLSRGANLQKYYFKRNPKKVFLGIVPGTITDGKRTLLVNGFWGLSRHINYLGEILMASGIVLAVGHPTLIWPWLYPLYYVALLFPRQADDDKRCAEKYEELWQAYLAKVPYRIIPFIY